MRNVDENKFEVIDGTVDKERTRWMWETLGGKCPGIWSPAGDVDVGGINMEAMEGKLR